MRFAGRLLARADRGKVTAEGSQLRIAGAGEAVILLAAATDYNLAKLNFDRAIDPAQTSAGILANAAKKSWPELLRTHLPEHSAMFNRVSLQLDGTLVIVPSTSPENTYRDPDTKERIRITIGSTYHQSLVRAIFDATDRAAAILATDPAMRRRIAEATAKLPPLKVGPDGRLLEWAEPYPEAEPGHRHMSHLVGLHPFDLITPATPVLLTAARKVLDYRLSHGGGGTGWSRAR